MLNVVFFLLGNILVSKFYAPMLQNNLSVPSYTTYEDGTDSVPKHRHIKVRRPGINQDKEYNIQNMVKVENQDVTCSEMQIESMTTSE
jgi:hypothetical protein